MRQKTKSKKIKKNKVLKRALAFFCFFIFAFSLLNLNLAFSDFSGSGLDFSIVNEANAGTEHIDLAEESGGWWPFDNPFVVGINWILYGFFRLLALLLGIAGFLFDWAIDANNIRDVIHRQAIYDAWKMVRDFLNLGFILILLYSAFCTIFQIEKYHLKKILLMLVLMALLVNFSFPISRFIVDASNVTMYYFLNSAFNQEETKSFSAGLTGPTGIADMLVPRESDGDFDSGGSTVQIMMAIFFIFCLMITMFVIAAIFVIRIVALAVLIIFSSIGFVAAVFPDTKSFANQWWSNLFKYAFTGPILVFMMLIAYNLMREMAAEGTKESMKQYAQNYGHNPSLLANAAYFFIPIVILWMGIIATQKMGIAGADWTVKKATGARDWFAKIPVNTARGAGMATGIPGGAKQATEYYKKKGLPGRLGKIWGLRGTDKREESEAKFEGAFVGAGKGETPWGSLKEMKKRWEGGSKSARDKRIGEKVKENKDLNVSASQLSQDLGSENEVAKTAAAITMAEKGLLTDIDRFKKALEAVGNDEDLKKKIIDKAPKEITRDVIKDGKSLNTALTAAVIKDEKGNEDKEATKRVQETIKGKIKADNNVKILIDYDERYGGKSKDDAYRDNLEKMSAENLAKQKNLLDTQEFHEFFLRDKASGGLNEDPDFIAKTAENMNMKDRLDWRKRGYKI
ncbi:type IV secretion system protein [bacterium]|nr:type IV secretion system protein [bacterium]